MDSQIAQRRLQNQQLSTSGCDRPEQVVAWLGAVQAQEYLHAKWAIGLRMRRATDREIEQAFNDGAILRTHVLRPTWHFLTPDDIRWVLELTAPRVHKLNGTMYRKLAVDPPVLARSIDAIARALAGGNYLTRQELGAALAEVEVPAEGMRLGYIVHYAELERVICSGPRRGKQFTYALLDERAPNARSLPREEALAELVRRYFTSHGPATLADFTWWSSLTVAEAKEGVALLGDALASETIDGRTLWFAPSEPSPHSDAPRAYLLPPFDEYISYRDRGDVFDPAHAEQALSAEFFGFLVLDGQIIGNWRRTFSKGTVAIDIAPYRPLAPDERDAFQAAAQRFGAFLEMPVELR